MTRSDEKRFTIDTYNKTAKIHSDKFNKLGPRFEDIKKTFSYTHKNNPKVLEIGCGDGRDAKEIIKRTNDYLGIDLSKELIKIAKKKVPKATFKIADFEKFQFPDGTDIVFAFASLLHSDKVSVKEILNKVAKSLNKGGVFFISSKYGEYERRIINKDNPKVNYLYTPKLIAEMTPPKLKIVYKNVQDFQGQQWFEVILQKI